MPKRKAFTDFSCPGCQSKFDSEDHVPFVGSCGHSLCGVCLNAKKNDACPVCNKEGGFAWKQKNDIAIELLRALSQDEAKNPKKPLQFVEEETYAPGEPVPAILDPKNLEFLAKIVYQLELSDFLKLSSTCKSMRNFCLNSKDVKIDYVIDKLVIRRSHRSCVFRLEDFLADMDKYFEPLGYSGCTRGFLSSKLNRKQLKKFPIVFILEKLQLHMTRAVNAALIARLRSFLAEFPVETILEIQAQHVADWDEFLQFVKDFNIKKVGFMHVGEMEDSDYEKYDFSIPEAARTYLLQNSDQVQIPGCISDDVILEASVHCLKLRDAKISKATFVELLLRFVRSTEDVEWTIGCQPFQFGHYKLFNVLSYDPQKPHLFLRKLSAERPLTVTKKGTTQRFCVLRKDGQVLDCAFYESIVVFSTTRWCTGYQPFFEQGVL